jgi:predicted dehydrogenase
VSFLCRYDDGLAAYGHVDYLQRPRRFTLSVTGTHGRMECDYHDGWLQTTGPTGTAREAAAMHRNDLFLAVLRDFFHAMRTGDTPRCSLADAADCLRVVDAIKESMATRREVEVR